jgi:lipoate-protein ligase A
MTESWFMIHDGPGDPGFNMALDEALLQSTPLTGRPVLRFYGWSRPAATFGYFQSVTEIERLTPLRPLIRRPTGGGLVPHAGDWTYSLVVPPGHPWFALRAAPSYRRLHQWLQAAWHQVGLATDLAPTPRNGQGQCFAGAQTDDLLWHGRKIAGAAQRRSKHGLLIQGSVQNLPPDAIQADWHKAVCQVGSQTWGIEWIPLAPSGALLDLAQQLDRDKYSRLDYHRKR